MAGTRSGPADAHDNGGSADADTDADDAFGGIVNLAGVHELDEASYQNRVTFTGLDPTKEYTITLTVNRDNLTYENKRYTKATIEGADTFVNDSSSGVVVNSEASVSFSAGYNYSLGYVARWTGVTAADGSFAILSEWDNTLGPTPGSDNNTKGYAMGAFKLEQLSPGP